MSNHVTDRRLQHALLDQLGDPGMAEKMGVQMSEIVFVRIVADHLLHGIHGQWTPTRLALESDKDVVHVGEECFPLLLQIPVQGCKRALIHEYRPCVATFGHRNVDAAATALNVLEANCNDFADPQTADPHQQHQRPVTPAAQCTKERAQIRLRNDVRYAFGFFVIQTLTSLARIWMSLTRRHRVSGKAVWVKQLEFVEQGRECGKASIDRRTGTPRFSLLFHEG